MLATDVKTQKIEPDPNIFYDGRKFWRQCVNLIDTRWGHVYFLRAKSSDKNFGLAKQSRKTIQNGAFKQRGWFCFPSLFLKREKKERKYWVRSWDSVERKESSTSLSRSCGTIIPSDSKFTSGCQWLSLMHCKRYCSHRLKRRPPIYMNSVFACKVALNCQNTSQNACCGCKTCRKSNLIWFFFMTDESFGGSV